MNESRPPKGCWDKILKFIIDSATTIWSYTPQALKDCGFGCYDWAFMKPNPMVQIFYMLVAGGGFAVYVKVGMM